MCQSFVCERVVCVWERVVGVSELCVRKRCLSSVVRASELCVSKLYVRQLCVIEFCAS